MKIKNRKGLLGLVLLLLVLMGARIYWVNARQAPDLVFQKGQDISYGSFRGQVLSARYLSPEEKEALVEDLAENHDPSLVFPSDWTSEQDLLALEIKMNQDRVPGYVYKEGLHDPILPLMFERPRQIGPDTYLIYYPLGKSFENKGREAYVLNLAGGDNEKASGSKAYVQLEVDTSEED